MQQAKSSHARRHEASGSRQSCASLWDDEASTRSGASQCPGKSNRALASSHHVPTASIHERMGKKRDARDTINDWRARSPSPDGPRPRAFRRRVRNVPFPPRFQRSTHVAKYVGDTNHGVWLEAEDEYFIIQYLPLCLVDSPRAWLEYLPHGRIQDWADLKDIFISNFHGTYTRPENSWDLKNCRQKPGETLRDYIW